VLNKTHAQGAKGDGHHGGYDSFIRSLCLPVYGYERGYDVFPFEGFVRRGAQPLRNQMPGVGAVHRAVLDYFGLADVTRRVSLGGTWRARGGL
jgi:hypothetical protein